MTNLETFLVMMTVFNWIGLLILVICNIDHEKTINKLKKAKEREEIRKEMKKEYEQELARKEKAN